MSLFHKALTLLTLSSAGIAQAQEPTPQPLGPVRTMLIKGCLSQFGEHPFDAENIETISYKVLAPSINVLSGSSVLLDAAQTAEPQLIIISSTVNVLGNATYKFLNSNGWYCLASNVSVFGSTHIDLNTEAKLVQLNIAVGSEVTITKVDAAGEPIPEGTEPAPQF